MSRPPSGMDRIVAALIEAGCELTSYDDRVMAQCPTHDDTRPSLSLTEVEGGKVLIHCFGNCDPEDVLEGLGLKWRDLSGAAGEGRNSRTWRAPQKHPSEEDIQLRAAVYEALLPLLRLGPEERAELEGRGLSKEQVERGQYRSLSWGLARPEQVVEVLEEDFAAEELLRVPGFSSARWGVSVRTGPQGLLIPSRDADGRILSLLIRPTNRKGGSKYLYFSSNGPDGPTASAVAHVSLHRVPGDVVRITEGVLKADVAAALSGTATIGVPGIGAYRRALDALEQLHDRPARVLVAYDVEPDKPQVASARDALSDALVDHGYEVVIEEWNPRQAKGIDDLIRGGGEPTLRPHSASANPGDTANGLGPPRLWSRVQRLPAFLNRPRPVMVIEDLLPRDSTVLLHGAPGSTKTFVALDLGLCVATGIPFQGLNAVRGRVLYVAAEGAAGLPSRIRAWLSEHEKDPLVGVRGPGTAFTPGRCRPSSRFWLGASNIRPHVARIRRPKLSYRRRARDATRGNEHLREGHAAYAAVRLGCREWMHRPRTHAASSRAALRCRSMS